MANDVAAVTTLRPAKPRLPAALAAILDREPAPDVGWQAPSDQWIKRHEQALRTAFADLQAALRPADETFIREKLAVLATYKGSRAGVPAEWELRRREYVRLLGHYPADIWEGALDEWMLGSRWFPDLSELNELMHPKLIERRRYVELIEAMLKALTPKIEHKPAACKVWREKEQAIKDEIGDREFSAWISVATPHSDNGKTLILAVPSKSIGLTIRNKFGPMLERILGREVKFILACWAGPAARERQAREDGQAAE